MPKRILITGASGLLGASLAWELAPNHTVFGVTNSTPLQTDRFTVLTADLLDEGELKNLMDRTQPDWVIHCAAVANLETCETKPTLARRLNSEIPGILADQCRKGGARLLHVSTDAVFDGDKGDYVETDTTNPLSVYAQTKLEGEFAVAQANPDAIIARVNLFGYSPSGKRSLAEFFLNNLLAGNRVKGFIDVFFCPMLVNEIAHVFNEMLENELSGLFHVFSADTMSKHAFGVAIAERFGLDTGLIAPIAVNDFGLAARRSPNLTMDTTKLSTALAHDLPTLSNMIERFYTLYQQGYPQVVREMIPDA